MVNNGPRFDEFPKAASTATLSPLDLKPFFSLSVFWGGVFSNPQQKNKSKKNEDEQRNLLLMMYYGLFVRQL